MRAGRSEGPGGEGCPGRQRRVCAGRRRRAHLQPRVLGVLAGWVGRASQARWALGVCVVVRILRVIVCVRVCP